MQNRTPVSRDARPALPDFTPVPRLKHRHDGWTPERQRAFIEALADTGCVSRAAAQVNMAQANCYTLRRSPGAESFRAAWEAALDYGLARLKDIAFERAIEGQLVPVFAGGKLVGHRRKRNDALLMFCLRHYGRDDAGRRTTVNYFSSRASAAAAAGEGQAAAEASASIVRTTVTADADRTSLDAGAAAEAVNAFEGVPLDAEAHAAIAAALEACAARRREADAAIEAGGEAAQDATADDPEEPFVTSDERALPWRGELEPATCIEEWTPFTEGEPPWALAGAALPDWATLAAPAAGAAPRVAGETPPAVAEVKKRPPRRRKAG